MREFLHRWLQGGARSWHATDWPVGLLDLVYQQADLWQGRSRPQCVWLGISPRRLPGQRVLPTLTSCN